MMDPLDGFAWNETALPAQVEQALVAFLARDQHGAMHYIGAGFVVQSMPTFAVALTAAHNLREIVSKRSPLRRVAPTALQEFLPQHPPIAPPLQDFVANTMRGDRAVMSYCQGFVFDERTDVGIAILRPQEPDVGCYPLPVFTLDDTPPQVGGRVVVMGFSNIACVNTGETVTLNRRGIVRVGTVAALHPDGHVLCRGSCFETTIPAHSGLSGSPVAYFDEMLIPTIGLISSDMDDQDSAAALDRTVAGHSIVATLPMRRVSDRPDGARVFELTMTVSYVAGNLNAADGG